MARISIEGIINNTDVGDMDYNNMLRYYRRMAKVADQRLVSLESYAYDKYFGGVLNYAYKGATHDLQKYGEGHRFNTKPPQSVNELRAKIKDIEKFILSETSTKTGVKRTYIQKANTVNERYGTNFTWMDLANYYMSGMADKMDRMFGSKTAMLVIGQLQKQSKKIKNDILKGKDVKLDIKPEFLDETVQDAIKQYGIDMDFLRK